MAKKLYRVLWRLGITSIIDPRYAEVVVIPLNTLHKSLIILFFSDIDIYLQCYQSGGEFSLPRVSRKIGNYNYNSADGTMQGNVLLYYYNKPTTRFYNGRERW
jgi:hypothetical protein